MGISRISLSSIKTLNRSDSFLDGNSPFIPSSFESIASSTGSGVSSITFSFIPNTYKSLQLRFSNLTADTIRMRINGDTGANYVIHYLSGSGGNVYAGAGVGTTYTDLTAGWYGSTGTAPDVGIIDIIDYASTTKNKTIKGIHGSDRNSTATGDITLYSSLWLNTAAINSLTIFTPTSINFATGTSIALYGIK